MGDAETAGHGPEDPILRPEDGADHHPGADHDEDVRGQLLKQAYVLINGDRAAQYGDAYDTHERIARMWGALIGVELTPSHVAQMMICVKLVRAHRSPEYMDSWVDIAGYAALGGEFAHDR